MKPIQSKKKLSLNKETLRQLDGRALEQVAGGLTTVGGPCPPSPSKLGVCPPPKTIFSKECFTETCYCY